MELRKPRFPSFALDFRKKKNRYKKFLFRGFWMIFLNLKNYLWNKNTFFLGGVNHPKELLGKNEFLDSTPKGLLAIFGRRFSPMEFLIVEV